MANGHGGKRKGSGRKGKPLHKKMLDGNPSKRKHKVLNVPDTPIVSKEMPDYLNEYIGIDNVKPSIKGIYEQTINWLEHVKCLKYINPEFIADYVIYKTRSREFECMVARGLQHQTNMGIDMAVYIADLSAKYQRLSDNAWAKIEAIVERHSTKLISVSPNQSAMLELLSYREED